MKKGVFFGFTANIRKREVQICPVTRIARKYPFAATRKFEKRRSQPPGTLSFALKISRLLRPYGAGGGTRTHTVSLPTDFESVTSTNSITPAFSDFILYRMGFQNSRETFRPLHHVKNEQSVKNVENRKKDYPRPGKRAIIYLLNYAYRQKGARG